MQKLGWDMGSLDSKILILKSKPVLVRCNQSHVASEHHICVSAKCLAKWLATFFFFKNIVAGNDNACEHLSNTNKNKNTIRKCIFPFPKIFFKSWYRNMTRFQYRKMNWSWHVAQLAECLSSVHQQWCKHIKGTRWCIPMLMNNPG